MSGSTRPRIFGRQFAVAVGTVALLAACGGDTQQEAVPDGATPDAAAAPAQTVAAVDGAQIYTRCATCHQVNGQGLPGTYPPLANSAIANGDPVVPVAVITHGLQGPIEVDGKQFNSVMPPYGTGQPLSDDEIAAVLTYVRTSFGNSSGAVTAQQVADARARIGDHTGPFTFDGLKALQP